MNNTVFIMMIGLSGSGKSTKAQELSQVFFGGKAMVLSSDELRRTMLGDVNDNTQNNKIFNELHRLTIEYLKNGISVIYDATSLTIKDRASILAKIENIPCEKYAYLMTTSFEDCCLRNSLRQRVVPEEVIYNQRRKFQIPFKEEGFNEIIVDGWEEEDFCEFSERMQLSPKYRKKLILSNFDQKTKWHKFDLLTHCNLCAENVKKRSKNNLLYQSAKFHDFGKLDTQTFDEEGQAHYFGHANVGAYNLLLFVDDLDYFQVMNFTEALEILFYINYHMDVFNWNTEKAHNKWKKIFGEEKYNNLVLFNECDKASCGN